MLRALRGLPGRHHLGREGRPERDDIPEGAQRDEHLTAREREELQRKTDRASGPDCTVNVPVIYAIRL